MSDPTLSKRQKGGYIAAGIGFVLAVVFIAVAFAVDDSGLKSGMGAASMVCLVAGVHGLAIGVTDKMSAGRWWGLGTGAVLFVGWGIAWLALSCGSVSCTNFKTMFGWMALFSAIAAIASLFPKLFAEGVKF